MIKDYGKEAYYKLEELTSNFEDEETLSYAWKEDFRRVMVTPNQLVDLSIFHVTKKQKVDFNLSIGLNTNLIQKVELYVDHVCMGSSTNKGDKLSLSTSFYMLPSSTMQLLFYGEFTSESMLLHSSMGGVDITCETLSNNTFFSYTYDKVYTLTLIDNDYYFAECALGSVPTLLTFGKTSTFCGECLDFAVCDYDNEVIPCVLSIMEGNVNLLRLNTNQTISIEGKNIDCASIMLSSSGEHPLQVLFHGKEGWNMVGVTKDFTLSEIYTCDKLNGLSLRGKADRMRGISSTNYITGANGFIGCIKDQVIYFMPSTPLLKQDILNAVLLNIGQVDSLWGVERSDGVHLVAKVDNGLTEYLLTKENNKVKLSTLLQVSNAQDIVYSADKKYILYEDKFYLVEG